MKALFTLALSCFLGLTFVAAQTTDKSKTGTAVKAEAAPNPKEQFLIKPWKIEFIEEFKVKGAPRGKQKEDNVSLKEDKTFSVTFEGETKTGKWMLNKAGTAVTLLADSLPSVPYRVKNPKNNLTFKIIQLDDKVFNFSYQSPDLITRLFYLIPKN